MSAPKPGIPWQSIVPPPIAVPTEAEARAAELEQDEAASRQNREARIREAAYARYQQRGSEPGHEEEDWLAAERQVDQEAGDGPEVAESFHLRPRS